MIVLYLSHDVAQELARVVASAKTRADRQAPRFTPAPGHANMSEVRARRMGQVLEQLDPQLRTQDGCLSPRLQAR